MADVTEMDALDWTKTILEVSGTLSFALPEPFGPLVAGALNFLQVFLPGSKQELPFVTLEKHLEKAAILEKVRDAALAAKDVAQWIHERLELCRDGKQLTVTVLDDWKSSLILVLGPAGKITLRAHIAALEDIVKTHGDLYTYGTVEALALAMSTYLAALKFRMQLEGFKTSLHFIDRDLNGFGESNGTWRMDHREFILTVMGSDDRTIPGFAKRIDDAILGTVSDRLGKIQAVHDEVFISEGRYRIPFHSWVWSDGDELHEYGQNDKAAADREYGEHVAKVTGELDKRFDKLRQTTKAWQAMSYEWSKKLPPDEPTTVPTLVDWVAPAPVKPWKDMRTVDYAFAFWNHAGPGVMSSWSSKMEIKDGKHPKIKVPTDPKNEYRAERRWIYRRFTDEKGAQTTTTLLAYITDNSAEVFDDTDAIVQDSEFNYPK